MRVGIVTIQKNRASWIPEWIAFHHLAGIERFYFYAHNCTDETTEVLQKLAHFYDIKVFAMNLDQDRVQLHVYKHAYDNFGHECDWFAFIDCDEFLFPVADPTIGKALERFTYEKVSAIGVYWSCFGSSGHINEPAGLITKNYRYRRSFDALPNRHVKSIVRGRQVVEAGPNAHIFNTLYGTVDENFRSINKGLTDYDPTYQYLRINHYICQSVEYFRKIKQRSGAADASLARVRPDAYWAEHDHNDVFDDSLEAWYPKLEAEIERIGFSEFAGQIAGGLRWLEPVLSPDADDPTELLKQILNATTYFEKKLEAGEELDKALVNEYYKVQKAFYKKMKTTTDNENLVLGYGKMVELIGLVGREFDAEKFKQVLAMANQYLKAFT